MHGGGHLFGLNHKVEDERVKDLGSESISLL